MVSHDLAGVTPVSDRIVFLSRRVVCQGRPAEVLANPELRRTFGLDVVPLETGLP
jgi:ABC-type Mn2+/Zn2+ transport system ATPase subunit